MIIKGTLSVVDVKLALQTMSGYESILEKVIESFLENQSNLVNDIESALGKNIVEAHRLVHSCKGISKNLGCEKLYDVAFNLEQAILKKENIDYHFSEFKKLFPIFLEDLHKISF